MIKGVKPYDNVNGLKKALDKNPIPPKKKNPFKKITLNLIKNICRKLNIVLDGANMSIFPCRLGTRQECTLTQLLSSIVLEVQVIILKQKKEKKYIKKSLRKEEAKESVLMCRLSYKSTTMARTSK